MTSFDAEMDLKPIIIIIILDVINVINQFDISITYHGGGGCLEFKNRL